MIILDSIYNLEVNIFQYEFEKFIAKRFKLQGLLGSNENEEEKIIPLETLST